MRHFDNIYFLLSNWLFFRAGLYNRFNCRFNRRLYNRFSRNCNKLTIGCSKLIHRCYHT